MKWRGGEKGFMVDDDSKSIINSDRTAYIPQYDPSPYSAAEGTEFDPYFWNAVWSCLRLSWSFLFLSIHFGIPAAELIHKLSGQINERWLTECECDSVSEGHRGGDRHECACFTSSTWGEDRKVLDLRTQHCGLVMVRRGGYGGAFCQYLKHLPLLGGSCLTSFVNFKKG